MEYWLKCAIEIQSLAQAGLAYTENAYDRERFERLREISAEMLSKKTDISLEKIKELFSIPKPPLCISLIIAILGRGCNQSMMKFFC